MSFDDFLFPMTTDQFFADYWGKKPVVIPAENATRHIFKWADFNALFDIRSHWTADNCKLIMNSRAVDPSHYVGDALRPFANVGQVENFTAMGASVVLDEVEKVAPAIAKTTDLLVNKFGGWASANFYASFQGVQAFASHCDTHEVLALHCEGEKRWRVYENRADNPLEILTGEGAQEMIDAAKGRVIMDIVLQPGDLLYIPRGYFHDAVATGTASLHLTFGFRPLTGVALFVQLEKLAREDASFRGYLPYNDNSMLEQSLTELGARLLSLMQTPKFREVVALEQRRNHVRPASLCLPQRPTLTFFARTHKKAQVADTDSGAVVDLFGQDIPIGPLADLALYALERPAFSQEELVAKFPAHDLEEITMMLHSFLKFGLIEPYNPTLV